MNFSGFVSESMRSAACRRSAFCFVAVLQMRTGAGAWFFFPPNVLSISSQRASKPHEPLPAEMGTGIG
jgi:hypothetical protein